MELYHVLNRGVEKRDVFLDDKDRFRFVHDLYEFNDTAPAGNAYKRFQNQNQAETEYMDVRRPYISGMSVSVTVFLR